MGTIRSFDYEAAITLDPLPEVTAKLCFVEIDGEQLLEIKSLGPVDDVYTPADLQVLRLTKQALDEIVAQWKSFSTDAQKN